MQNLADIVLANPMIDPARPALADRHERIDYVELTRRITAVARFLESLDDRPGDRVAVLLPNCCAFIEILLACAATGRVCVPLNIRLLPDEQAEILVDAQPSVLFVEGDYADRLDVFQAKAPSLRTIVQIGASRQAAGLGARIDYAQLRRADGAGFVQQRGLDANVLMLYTSGTTSRAKGAPLTHANVLANLRQYQAAVRLPPGGVNLQLSPMFHAAGVFCLLHLMQGGLSVFVPQIEPGQVLETIERERVTFMFTVPTVLYQLLDHADLLRRDLSTLQRVQYGAAPITGGRLTQALGVFGQRLMHSYGMTEATSHVSILLGEGHLRKPGSVGQVLPGVEVRIVDESGRGVDADQFGEVRVRGANVFAGYWKQPQASADVFSDGWLCTGDIGKRDAEGFLYVIDRKKDVIISGGVNIYPSDIEDALMRHAAVAEAAVFGVADEVWGEAVAAAVVVRPGMAVDAAALTAHLRGRLAGYKIPKRLWMLDALPKNASGKVLKRALRSQFK